MVPLVLSLKANGYGTFPFTAINKNLADLLQIFVKPIVNYTTYCSLRKLPNVTSDGITTRLNIFSSERYEEFLRMISIEDIEVEGYLHQTVKWKCMSKLLESPSAVFPVIKKSADLDSYLPIARSYFPNNAIHLVSVTTQATGQGRQSDITEYCLYIPESFI